MLKIILISVVLSVVLSSVITIFAMRIVSDVITLFVSRTEERFDKKLEIYKQLKHHEKEKMQVDFEKAKSEFESRNKFS